MILFPLPVIAAITLGIVGAVIESLSYLSPRAGHQGARCPPSSRRANRCGR